MRTLYILAHKHSLDDQDVVNMSIVAVFVDVIWKIQCSNLVPLERAKVFLADIADARHLRRDLRIATPS